MPNVIQKKQRTNGFFPVSLQLGYSYDRNKFTKQQEQKKFWKSYKNWKKKDFSILAIFFAVLVGACNQPKVPERSPRSVDSNGDLSPELKAKLAKAEYLDKDKFDLAGMDYTRMIGVSDDSLCPSIVVVSEVDFDCACNIDYDFSQGTDFYVLDSSEVPYRVFPGLASTVAARVGGSLAQDHFDDSYIGLFPDDGSMCGPFEIDSESPSNQRYVQSEPYLAPGYGEHGRVIRDISGDLIKFDNLADAKTKCDELDYCHRVWQVNGRYIGVNRYEAGEFFLFRAGVTPTNVAPTTAGKFYTKANFTQTDHLVTTRSKHHFFTHSPLPEAISSLNLSSDYHEKYEYKISDEIGNPRFVEGFGALKKSGGAHQFFFWYSDGKYTTDTDLDHATQARMNFSFDSGLGVDTPDIVAMAVLGRAGYPLKERVLTVFADENGYFYSVGTPSDLSKDTGTRKIRIQVPDNLKIVGVSAHPTLHVEVRFYLSNYNYVKVSKGYLGTDITDPRRQSHFTLDFRSSKQYPFKLIEGKGITDVVSIGGLDRDNIFTMYYDEVSADLSGNHQFVKEDFQVFVSHSSGDSSLLGSIETSQNINQGTLETSFKNFDFSDVSTSSPIKDAGQATLINIWNGTSGSLAPKAKCTSDMLGVAIDLTDVVLDLFSLTIDYEDFVKEIEVGFGSKSLTDEQKINEAAKAVVGKFFGPISKVKNGIQGGNVALIAQGIGGILKKGYTYIVAGVKQFFSSWEGWLKFGAALIIAGAEAETTGGTYLLAKVAEIMLDMVNLGLDLPELITDCQAIHAGLDLEDET